MKRCISFVELFGTVILVCGVFVKKALGYLDPATGSYLLQLLLGGLLGGLYVMKAYWKRITIFVKNFLSK